MAQVVEIRLRKDELIITLNEKCEYKEIQKALKKKIPELKKLYKEDKTPIFVTGKVLKNKEIEEIKNIIKSEINVEIEFDSPKVLGLYGIKKAYNQDIGASTTIYHKGSIRSGQKNRKRRKHSNNRRPKLRSRSNSWRKHNNTRKTNGTSTCWSKRKQKSNNSSRKNRNTTT